MGIEPNGAVRQAKMSGRSPAHSNHTRHPRITSSGGVLEFRAGSGGGIAISGGGLCGVRFPIVWLGSAVRRCRLIPIFEVCEILSRRNR